MVGEPTDAGHQVETADDLYRADPEAFVAARDALARRLRNDGRRDEAAAVSKLRRPTPTAWALNQVARDEPSRIEQLLAAGQGLREATEEAVRGDASELRAAQEAERAAVHAATQAAAARLRSRGRPATDAMLRRLAGTLRAAIVDDAVAAELREGRLEADREAPGLGLPGLDPGAVAARPVPHAADAGAEARRAARAKRAEMEAEAERLERRAVRLEDAARHAEAMAAEARAEADEARAAADDARRRLEAGGE
jgi:hypothetical protein